jgi:hypothetical protein
MSRRSQASLASSAHDRRISRHLVADEELFKYVFLDGLPAEFLITLRFQPRPPCSVSSFFPEHLIFSQRCCFSTDFSATCCFPNHPNLPQPIPARKASTICDSPPSPTFPSAIYSKTLEMAQRPSSFPKNSSRSSSKSCRI